jgi:hypothetical protein
MRCASIACAAAIAVATVGVASAQPEASGAAPSGAELAAARQLFNEALALETSGEWQGALERLERVAKVKMTPQVRYHIAYCHENLGKLVEAINGFELAEQEARALGDAARDVLENAPAHAEALRAKVAHLEITVRGKLTRSKILLDGQPLSPALLGNELPVNPGSHLLRVERDGKTLLELPLDLASGQHNAVELPIDDPPLPDAPPTDDAPSPAPPLSPEPEGEMARLPAYIVGGAGVLTLAGAGVLWALRGATVSNVRDNCTAGDRGCDPDDRETAELAEGYHVASQVTLGVGAAALATGVVLWFVLAPDDAPPATGAKSTRLHLVPTLGGVSVFGSF